MSYKTFQSNRHHQQTNNQLSTDWMPFRLPNQQCQCQSTKGNRKKLIKATEILYKGYYNFLLLFN